MDKSSSKSKAQISLSVENLITSLTVNGINYRSLDGISLTIKKGEVYGLTGESNSGKTLLAESIMNLIPENKGMVESGNVIFNKINTMYYHTGETRKSLFSIKKDKEVKKKKPKNYDKLMEELRGKRISYLMQDSFHSLNPSMTIGDHMVEVLMRHRIPEIGRNIIKKSKLTRDSFIDFLEEVKGIKVFKKRESMVVDYCKTNGLDSHISEVMEIVENDIDYEMPVSLLMDKVNPGLKEKQVRQIEKISDYYNLLSRIDMMKLEMCSSDLSERENLKLNIKTLERECNKKYFPLKISLLFSKRFMLKEFVKEARAYSIETMKSIGIEKAESIFNKYHDQLPPGIRHLCLFGLAIIGDPDLMILDEPTSSMDTFTQTKLLDSVRKLSHSKGKTVLFITNEIALLAGIAGRLGIIYAGNLIEESTTLEIFNNSKHPFTIDYLSSSKVSMEGTENNVPLEFIQGEPPDLVNPPSGCKFHPRCKFAMDVCSVKVPGMIEVSRNHRVACFLYSDKTEVQ